MCTTSTMGNGDGHHKMTVAGRISAVDQVSNQFHNHLVTVPGVALSSVLRLAVVQCARDAITCTGCPTDLPAAACLKPGTDVYAAIGAIQHTTASKEADGDTDIPASVQKVLVTIVHSIISHQGRLDQAWYDAAVQAIADNTDGLLPASLVDDDQRQTMAYAAFAEILILTAMSHCIHIAYLVMGRPVPRLPTFQEMKEGPATIQGPLWMDWSTLLKCSPRRNLKTCHAYYISPRDVNQRSSEFKRISKEGWASMKDCLDVMNPRMPVGLAIEDTAMFDAIGEAYYVPNKDMMALYNTELDPSIRCADAFSRYDVEFVATKVAEVYECNF